MPRITTLVRPIMKPHPERASTASVTRAPPTNKPFFEPKSRITSPRASAAIRQWAALTVRSSTRTEALVPDPIVRALPGLTAMRRAASGVANSSSQMVRGGARSSSKVSFEGSPPGGSLGESCILTLESDAACPSCSKDRSTARPTLGARKNVSRCQLAGANKRPCIGVSSLAPSWAFSVSPSLQPARPKGQRLPKTPVQRPLHPIRPRSCRAKALHRTAPYRAMPHRNRPPLQRKPALTAASLPPLPLSARRREPFPQKKNWTSRSCR